MQTLSNSLKTLATVGLIGFGASAAMLATAKPAAADNFYTRCDSDGDNCYRVRCDDFDGDCERVSGYYRTAYSHRRWVCDEDGDNCHWAYYDRPYSYYSGPHLRFGFGF